MATYMLEGGGGDRTEARIKAFAQPDLIDRLIDILVEATVLYLCRQVEAGAQVFQIFELRAEQLPEVLLERLVTSPHACTVSELTNGGVTNPIVGFPCGGGALIEQYAIPSRVDCVGLDVQAPATLGRRIQNNGLVIQGALDPRLLRIGVPALDKRVSQLIDQWGMSPFIFNLGHGVLPDTPLSNIASVVRRVRGQ